MRLSAMSDADAHQWAATRQRGRGRYVLIFGGLGWGIPIGVGSTVLTSLLFGAPGPFLGRLVLNVVVFTLAGILAGRKQWIRNERRYEAWQNSVSHRSTP